MSQLAVRPGATVAPTPRWAISSIDAVDDGTDWATTAVTDYLDSMRVRGLRPDTIRTRKSALTSIAKDVRKPILVCTPAELSKWQVTTLRRDQWTRHAYARELRLFLEWSRLQKLCGSEMRDAVQAVRTPKGRPRPAPLDDIVIALTIGDPRMHAWLALAAFGGLRAGEIARLRGEDVDLRQMLLEVRDGKGGRDRTVLIGEQLLELLKPFLRRRGRLWDTRPIRVTQLVSKHFQELGMPWTCHNLRHSYGTELYRISQDIRLVQEQLGHASPATTAIYTRPNSEAARRSVGQWDADLSGRRRPSVRELA